MVARCVEIVMFHDDDGDDDDDDASITGKLEVG